jgi:hypothetical protein
MCTTWLTKWKCGHLASGFTYCKFPGTETCAPTRCDSNDPEDCSACKKKKAEQEKEKEKGKK